MIRSLKLVCIVALAMPDRMLVGKAAQDSSSAAIGLDRLSRTYAATKISTRHRNSRESARYLSESTMTNPCGAAISRSRRH